MNKNITSAKNFRPYKKINFYDNWVVPMLNGIAQIMLQQNKLTGFLFLLGIFYGAPLMGLACILATFCGTLTAKILNYPATEISQGLYGFSAALVGVACILFLKPTAINGLMIIIGSALASILQHLFIRKKTPVFTLPFVLITWIILLFITYVLPDMLFSSSVGSATASPYYLFAFKGFGQVIFQDNLWVGLLFFIAVLVSSPVAAIYALAAAFLSGWLAGYFSVPSENIAMGLYSFNAVLCAIVFAGKQLADGVWVVVAVLLSLGISLIFLHLKLPQLTFPFVMASCLTLLLKNRINFVH